MPSQFIDLTNPTKKVFFSFFHKDTETLRGTQRDRNGEHADKYKTRKPKKQLNNKKETK